MKLQLVEHPTHQIMKAAHDVAPAHGLRRGQRVRRIECVQKKRVLCHEPLEDIGVQSSPTKPVHEGIPQACLGGRALLIPQRLMKQLGHVTPSFLLSRADLIDPWKAHRLQASSDPVASGGAWRAKGGIFARKTEPSVRRK